MIKHKTPAIKKNVKIPLDTHIKMKSHLARIAEHTKVQLEIEDFVERAILEKIENSKVLNSQ